MLQIKDFCYRYESREDFTLKNISLDLEQGEMLLLAGKSGCGKSTLVKAVSGLLSRDANGEFSGEISLQSRDIFQLSAEAIGLMVGTVYQSPDDQLFAMTVSDEVGFALENQGLPDDEIQARVAEVLKVVSLDSYSNSSIHKLSGGQRQRLALASILVTKPKLLILDEPVSQMNPQGVKSFMELLTRLNRDEKISILMVEHRVNELAGYFRRLAVMDDGRIIYDGEMEKAWRTLAELEDSGLREPLTVKLCKALHLSGLTAERREAARMLKEECNIKPGPAKLSKEVCGEGEVILQVDSLSYTYPGSEEPVLHNIDFKLYRAQITALMGYNGAGKSTLLDILGGLKETGAGNVLLCGEAIRKALGRLGYLRQEPDLMLLADTVREELSWKNEGMTRAEMDVMLKKLKLTEYADDFPLALSKGQRLRVVLGAMLAKKPQLLLLDEPTTGQDENSLGEIKRLLCDFRDGGGSVFICTHDIELASEIADRVIVMNRGNLIADDIPDRVLSNEKILQSGGLMRPVLLDICREVGIPDSITVQEVKRHVYPSAVGRE